MSDITKKKNRRRHSILFPKQKMKNSQNSSLWWMYMPAVLVVSTFIIYPFFNGIQLSFTNWNGFSQNDEWIGLDQYKRLLQDPTTWLVVKNTLLYGIGSTILQNIIGLGYALLLHQSLKMRAITRTVIYLPVILISAQLPWAIFGILCLPTKVVH